MTFGGVDLAADPTRTALAEITEGTSLVLRTLLVGVDDDAIVDLVRSCAKVGVDVPVGWPDPFVALVSDHAERRLAVPASTGSDWRRTLAMRTTDLSVRKRTGKVPLSVSTDRIAYPALRWAGIEARLHSAGVDVSRDGTGHVCEVYPAAALSSWSLPNRGYKGRDGAGVRSEIVELISRKFPALDWKGYESLCIDDDNALDSVVAALMARSVAAGEAEPPPAELREIALREGWIWLPRAAADLDG